MEYFVPKDSLSVEIGASERFPEATDSEEFPVARFGFVGEKFLKFSTLTVRTMFVKRQRPR